MQVVHRIGFNPDLKRDAGVGKLLRAIGINVRETGKAGMAMLCVFEMSEADPRWADVSSIVSTYTLPDDARKRFTQAEVRSASWSYICPGYFWDRGYPMPEEDSGFASLSFDPSKECHECGYGRFQRAPLRLADEPPPEAPSFMGIFWTLSFCARLDVMELMRQKGISGFESLEILRYGSDEPLKAVAQLGFPQEIVHGLIDNNLERDQTPCGHVKYIPPSRELIRCRSSALQGCPDFVRTSEWFGAGGHAVNAVLASSAFVNLCLDMSWKGIRIEPIELVA